MERYFSVRFDFPYPEKFISAGSFSGDLDCNWYIMEKEIDAKFTDFCVPRLEGRYVFIVDFWQRGNYESNMYKYFKKRFPSLVEGADPCYVAFSNSPDIDPTVQYNKDGDECGSIIVIDLELNRSTFTFVDKYTSEHLRHDKTDGTPLWKED
uniref:Uncharacterized protein n=1 Tax=Pithovirus LCPAC404 TaxID=2506597 RepID=A0A481ZBL4_9VIRU|nr:MAG: hypothetical protein LCPAC404_00020 [Pithovirus LCPAC404]